MEQNLDEALRRKAVGYTAEEVVEEYSVDPDNGQVALTKRKVTKKDVPPDLSAMKALIELNGREDDLSAMTEEQLKDERRRLIEELKKLEDDPDDQ